MNSFEALPSRHCRQAPMLSKTHDRRLACCAEGAKDISNARIRRLLIAADGKPVSGREMIEVIYPGRDSWPPSR
jgi:hypothetical protein